MKSDVILSAIISKCDFVTLKTWRFVNTRCKELAEPFFINKINWNKISQKQLNKKFIRKYSEHVDWFYIFRRPRSEKLIRDFKNKIVSWQNISEKQKLSEDFIREFQDEIWWESISYTQKLSEEFIREFKDQVNWEGISQCQELSENFIREFKDDVWWSYIFQEQKLSEGFIREFIDKVEYRQWVVYQEDLSEEFIREFDIYNF